MKNAEDAIQLAQRMVEIGERAGRQTIAILTNMDVPLGVAVGNDIEVIEAIETLQGMDRRILKKSVWNLRHRCFILEKLQICRSVVIWFMMPLRQGKESKNWQRW